MKKYIKIISLLSILLLITITMFSCGKKKENKLLMTDNTSVLISDDTSTSTSENLDITTSDTTITSSSTTTSTSTSTSTSSVGHTTTTNTNTQSSTSTQTTTSNTTTTTQVVVTYDITFVNYNDRELTTLKVKEGETPIYNEIPTKEEDETYTYEFIGWDSELVPADSDKTYKATYRSVFKEYEVTFFNDQNQEILYSKYHYGDNILVPEDPEKESTDEYSYIFDGWYTSLEGGTKVTSFGKVENNVNYYAHFNADTTIYSVVWKNGTTTLNTESYKYGETPAYKGDTPTKTSTSAYTYTFSGWSPEIAKVTGNATYEAQFSQEDRYYTYTFYNEYACSTVFQTGKVKYNTLISIPSTKPTMDPSESYTYTFSDWYDKATNKSVRQNSSLLRITKDMKYYPSWTTTNRSYTMTFYTDETHVYTTITQPWGNNITLPTNPTKAGATFQGWSPEVPTTMPKQNTSYYALWATATSKITVKNNATNVTYTGVTSGNNYQSGTSITLSISSKPASYTIKWDVNGTSYTGDSITFTMPVQAVTITITSLPFVVLSNNKIQMGMYPQALVKDSTLKSNLRSVSHISASTQPDMAYWKSFGETTNPGTQINNYYIDIEYKGDRYRGIYLTNYRPKEMIYNTWSQNDSYQFSNGYNTGTYYWFKYEPITWTTCLTDDGNQYMYSDMILDAFYYNKALDNTVQYYKSGLYSYMQNDFTKFFTTEELSLLVNLTSGGATAKIVIPSADTITGPFTSPNITKKAQATDYAKCRGIYVESGYSEWWTTTSANSTNYVKIVGINGSLSSAAINELSGVRPFIAFDMAKTS